MFVFYENSNEIKYIDVHLNRWEAFFIPTYGKQISII